MTHEHPTNGQPCDTHTPAYCTLCGLVWCIRCGAEWAPVPDAYWTQTPGPDEVRIEGMD